MYFCLLIINSARDFPNLNIFIYIKNKIMTYVTLVRKSIIKCNFLRLDLIYYWNFSIHNCHGFSQKETRR